MVKNLRYSILIPNLGFNPSLFRCLESVINLTKGDFEYEIILCDQSDDNVFHKIVSTLKEKHLGKVIFFHSDIKSLFIARHSLMNKAKGEYIIFVDSDDVCKKDYLIDIDFIISNNHPDLLITSFLYSDENLNFYERDSKLENEEAKKPISYFLYAHSINSIWRKVFKRELYNRADYSDFDITIGEDFAFSLPIVYKSKKIEINNNIKDYIYVQSSTTMMKEINSKSLLNLLNISYYKFDISKPNSQEQSLYAEYLFNACLLAYEFKKKETKSYKKILRRIHKLAKESNLKARNCKNKLYFCFISLLKFKMYFILTILLRVYHGKCKKR